MIEYRQFLASKQVSAEPAGFDVQPEDIHPEMMSFQAPTTRWALRRGRAALFWGCGLGKTFAQLEWAHHVHLHTGGDVLILAPLAVAPQTAAEGERFDRPVTICRSQDDVRPGINVTNYEMLHHFDASHFVGVVLDESSILKSYMGKTKRAIIEAFQRTPYRLACTATPAPNDHVEMGTHAEFLGLMTRSEMMARWFVNDSGNTSSWRLKGHAAVDFWRWVATWASAMESPSDLGYKVPGFDLPPLNLFEHVVDAEAAPPEGMLFHAGKPNATEIHRDMRQTTDARAEKVAELVEAEPDRIWILWCNTNYEADALMKSVPGAVDLRGSESPDAKRGKLEAFSRGEIMRLVTKPPLAGWGLNWQHCDRMAYVGLGYSFELFYQSVRRCWRYGQKNPVECHVVAAQSELGIVDSIKRKEQEHAKMLKGMVSAMKEKTMEGLQDTNLAKFNHERDRKISDMWEMRLGDSIEELQDVDAETVGLSVFSPPFLDLFVYSDAVADMGNSASMDEFMTGYGFLSRELLRVTKTGRLCVVHCKDLPRFKWQHGSAGLIDFPGEIIRQMQSDGWIYHSRVTIWKCPVTEMTRSKAHGLLYKQLRKDSSASRQAMADYLLVFRKFGEDEHDPVAHPEPDMVSSDVIDNGRVIPLSVWQEWASPVWMDIDQGDTLNYAIGRDEKDERHICPLQLGVIERCIVLWSNEGDLVLSPFAGIGSEGYVARKLGRRFLGVELKRSYYDLAIRHIGQAEDELRQMSIGDVTPPESESESNP